jgi:DNA-directed RNA polymerase subunit RPC12/RpoP
MDTGWSPIPEKPLKQESSMKCPYCGCQRFYIKDPADEYETYAFDCESGEVYFEANLDAEDLPELCGDSPIHCEKCAWKGRFAEIKN